MPETGENESPQRSGTQSAGRAVGAVVLLAVAPSPSRRRPSCWKGRKSGAKTGTAVSNVEVTASKVGGGGSNSTTSEPSGKYKLTGLTGGTWAVTFVPPNSIYQTFEKDVPLTEGTTETLNAKLVESGTIAGTVTSAASGTGLAGVEVFVTNVGSLESELAFTEATATTRSKGSHPEPTRSIFAKRRIHLPVRLDDGFEGSLSPST